MLFRSFQTSQASSIGNIGRLVKDHEHSAAGLAAHMSGSTKTTIFRFDRSPFLHTPNSGTIAPPPTCRSEQPHGYIFFVFRSSSRDVGSLTFLIMFLLYYLFLCFISFHASTALCLP